MQYFIFINNSGNVQWNSSISETVWKGHLYIYIYTFLLRMADTMTFQNIELSPLYTAKVMALKKAATGCQSV